METKKTYYVKFKDEKGNLINDLSNLIPKLKDNDILNIEVFLTHLNNILEKTPEEYIEALRKLTSAKPYHLTGTLYYILKDSCEDENITNDLEYLSFFNDYEIDLFMILNYLRTK